MSEEKFLGRLSCLISSFRLEHSVSTRDVAVKLGEKYGLERGRVSAAALLHDCARELGDAELINMARQEGITIGETEKKLPVFLHGPVGAVIARKTFGINDIQVLRAISVHTTGAGKMSLLDKIIYIADKVEPGRNYPGVEKLRDLAFQDLNTCLLACLDNSIKFSLDRGFMLHPEICNARNGVLRDIVKMNS